MKIIMSDGTTLFNDLSIGDVFRMDNEYYIAIEEIYREGGAGPVNAVHLQTGFAIFVPYSERVKHVTATMTVEV